MKTLLQSLNTYHNYPRVIHRRDGKVIVKTCETMIEKGQVKLNGFDCTNPETIVREGDSVKFTLCTRDGYYIVI